MNFVRERAVFLVLLVLQQRFEIRKWPVLGARLLLSIGDLPAGAGAIQKPPVLVFMTVSTEQLPVAAVRRVVVVVVVPMMDFEQLQVVVAMPPKGSGDIQVLGISRQRTGVAGV